MVDLFYNWKFIKNICMSFTDMKLESNGGTMRVSHLANVNGYKNDMWFDKKAITNIIMSPSSLISKQYCVTFDSIDQMLVIHRDDKPRSLLSYVTRYCSIRFDIDMMLVIAFLSYHTSFL